MIAGSDGPAWGVYTMFAIVCVVVSLLLSWIYGPLPIASFNQIAFLIGALAAGVAMRMFKSPVGWISAAVAALCIGASLYGVGRLIGMELPPVSLDGLLLLIGGVLGAFAIAVYPD